MYSDNLPHEIIFHIMIHLFHVTVSTKSNEFVPLYFLKEKETISSIAFVSTSHCFK